MAPKQSFTRQQLIVLGVCVAIFALGQFHRASGGVFTPILMERFALSASTVGGLVSAMFLATLLAQVPFGTALDRVGPRSVLAVCILLVAGGTGLFALAFSLGAALGARVLIGVGLAAMGAASHVIIGRNFPQRDFGYVSGLVVTLGGIGGLLGTYPLALALERFDWALVFGAVAAVTLVLAGAVFGAVQPGVPKTEVAQGDDGPGGYRDLLAQAEFRKVLALGVVTYAPITTISGLWGGPFLQDVVGLEAEVAGAVLLCMFVATISGGYVFGQLDRRARSRRRVILVAVTFSVLCLAALALVPGKPAALSVGLLLLMVFSQQFYIPLGAHMRRIVPDAVLARASTLLALFSVAAIPAMQMGFGAILDAGAAMGLAVADQYRMAFGAMALLIMCAGLIHRTARQVDDP